MSASLYDTFGNEIRYQATLNTLTAYLDEATIKFALPEASSTFLEELADDSVPVDQVQLDVVRSRLVEIGFKEANAKALTKFSNGRFVVVAFNTALFSLLFQYLVVSRLCW